MSDRGEEHGGGFLKWIFLILFILLSPGIGMLIDTRLLFPPSPDAHGHGIPVFTILLPLFAIVLAGIFCIIGLCKSISKRASLREEHYEYLKVFQQSDNVQAPVLIFHEIDLESGRCSVRCIQIYRNRYVERFANHGVYMPVPPAGSMNMPAGQTAYTTIRQEFEEIWNSGRYVGPLAL